jgi:hypothetical protein
MRPEKICIECDKTFYMRKSGESHASFQDRIYCSQYCANHRKDYQVADKICKGCDIIFCKKQTERRKNYVKRLYCTASCYHSTTSKVRNFKDMTNQIVNGITFLEYTGACKWKVKCRCGKEYIAFGNNLRNKGYTSCGCYRQSLIIDYSKTDEERAQDRSTLGYYSWSTKVRRQYKHKCFICSAKSSPTNRLCSHHLDGWNWCIERRLDPSNGVCLCSICHKEFHKLYGNGSNTSEEFLEYAILKKGFNITGNTHT